MRSNGSWITLCLCLSAAVVIFAALLSFSRGGALALVVAGSVMLFTYYRRRLVFGGSLMGVGFLGLLVVGMLSFYGYEQVVTRLDDFAAGSIEDLDHSSGRRKIWAANVAAIQQGGLFGAGAGSHREIYPTYLQEPSEVEYLYAENGYLQVATENGWLGILILAFSIAVVGHWCWKANRHAPSDEQGILAGAVTAGLAASVAHSCVDFVWYIPSCMTLTIFLLACILRLAQLGNEQGSRSHSQVALSNGRWWALTGSAAAASVWAFSVSFGPGVAANDYRKYQLTAIASNSQAVEKLKSDQNAEPEFGDHQRLLGDTMIVHLRRALSRNPNSARAHQRLAAKYLTKFSECQLRADNAMSLDQIRDTVTASQFQSANELRKWLLVAFGKNSELLYRARFHALHALQLCPLQGRAYANLAKLSFLEGRGQETLDLYLRQAQRLRPHDCKLLYEIGEQRIQLRSVEQIKMAEQLWLRIFHFPGAHQLKIIHYLAGHSPAPVFLQAFQPDSSLLPYLWQRYRILGSSEDWRSIAAYAKDIAERECPRQSPYHAARTWHALASMQRDLGDLDGVLESYQHAFLAAPNIYWVRRELGRRLVRAGHYSHAETHLRWCQARHPEDEQLQTELIEATKRRLPQTAQRTHQSSSRR
ncbi:MAG: O-antigen ligase family protein [Planctomycetota bacterium]